MAQTDFQEGNSQDSPLLSHALAEISGKDAPFDPVDLESRGVEVRIRGEKPGGWYKVYYASSDVRFSGNCHHTDYLTPVPQSLLASAYW